MTDAEPPVIKAGEENTETPSEDTNTPPIIDTAAYEAKISLLNDSLAAKDLSIAELNAQILKQKAANYDLLTQVSNENTTEEENNDPTIQDETLDIEDLFNYKRN